VFITGDFTVDLAHWHSFAEGNNDDRDAKLTDIGGQLDASDMFGIDEEFKSTGL